jgi:hypothetical protein
MKPGGELTRFRDFARKCASTGHGPSCPAAPGLMWRTPKPTCSGCIPDGDRALFGQMADEIDAYLAGGQAEHLDLFGATTTEPTIEPADSTGARR